MSSNSSGDQFSKQNQGLADLIEGKTRALRVSDLAKLLNISERQVYKLAAENRIPHLKIAGSIRFDPSALAAWLRQRLIPFAALQDKHQRQG